ncbi:MAG: leucine-rich repeat domain-containing protein [Clostridiales bacterium]|nr:leucine-rich repeat domain-containing protein [Clostridiales bacterium]
MLFADDAFKKAALAALGAEVIENDGQLAQIDALEVEGAYTLNDLPRFPALTWLKLTRCELKSALALRQMSGLRSLQLCKVNGATAQDIAPLTGLVDLWIEDCGIWDIAPLAVLIGLKELTLWGMGIKDLSPLKNMTRMEDLSLYHNPIEDLSPIRGMKRLKHLTMHVDHLKNRRILLEKPFSTAFQGYTDFPENAPESAKKKKPQGKQALTWLANVHPRLPFCRDAALFKLTGGQERLVCRDLGREESQRFDLYLDDKPLAEIFINSSCEYSCHFRSGYGDGLMNELPCQAVSDQINRGFEGVRQTGKYLAPYMALMESGLYVVADFDMFPVRKDSEKDYDYFWDVPVFNEELHFIHYFVGGETQKTDIPLFLAPSRRAAGMSPARVEYYRARFAEGDAFPRAIALYLNGGVALLLDGHHKAAACAMEGQRVRTLVIFPMEKINNEEVEAAVANGVRLYLQRDIYPRLKDGKSAALCDGQDRIFGWVSCLEHMKKTRVYAEPLKAPDWGRVPDECRTEQFKDYPHVSALAFACKMNPQEVRRLLAEQKNRPRGQHDMDVIHELRAFAHMFPDGKWLSPTEREWLKRPDDKFEDYGYEVEHPNK